MIKQLNQKAMRKFVVLLSILMLTLFVSGTAFSAPKQSVGVVIVGGQEFRTPAFFQLYAEKMALLFPVEKYRVVMGPEMQNQYMMYWDKKGFLSEQTPTKDDLFAFAKETTYDYTLYLIITAKEDDWARVKKVRTSIDVRSILIKSPEEGSETEAEIVSNLLATDQGDSKTSPLRARNEALGRALDYLVANIKF